MWVIEGLAALFELLVTPRAWLLVILGCLALWGLSQIPAVDVWLCEVGAENRHRCGSAFFQRRCRERLEQALNVCEARR